MTDVNEPLAVREAPAAYVLETQPVGRASARHVGLKPDLHGIPQGYKQTEVGVIPEDWEVRSLGELASTVASGRSKANVPYGRYSVHGSTGVIGFSNSAEYEGDAILVARVGANAGRLNVVSGQYGVTDNTIIVRLKSDCYLPFFWRQMESKRLNSLVFGSGQPLITGTQIKALTVCVPSLPEQRAIAATLSDVDALLAKLDQLIAKKRDLKQAAMQQLLTGSTRLPGFGGVWEVKRLGEVFTITAGKSKSAYIATGGRYWIVDMGSVSTDGKLIVSKATNFHGDFLRLGDLVMPKDDIGGGGIIGKVGYIDADETYVLGDHVYRLSANIGVPLFLSYLINGHRTNSELRKKVIGSAQLGLGRKSVEEQEIVFPSNDEQTAIATILSDMDAEIAALEARRDKTRDLKQGMMQELLTGKIRLV